jgi:4-hydroxyphenylacetate 3-monooxygenase
MLRISEKFIQSLQDGRNVWLNGKILDVTKDENFSGTLSTITSLFDMFEDSSVSDLVGYKSPKTEEYVHTAFLIPHSYEELLKRRRAFEVWSQSTDGVMSRLSDYSRSRLTGWYSSRLKYKIYDQYFPDKIKVYYEEARDQHRMISVVQRDPQINRSNPIPEANEAGLLRITKKTEDGVMITGAKMIGTAAPYSNDLIVYPVARLTDKHIPLSHMLVVPVNSPGLHVVCRESFASDSSKKADYPLSFQYDEMDALIIFDNVFVPWERVLLHDNPEAIWQIKSDSASNSLAYHQAIVRLGIKLEFVTAIAIEIAESIGADTHLHVQEKIGELITQVKTISGLIVASECQGKVDSYGAFIPDFGYIETARNLGSKYYPRAIDILQQIGAGGFIQLPSSVHDFEGPLSPLLKQYYKGANIDAEKRTKLFKLAWDLIGSPLGSRHELYERFYSGDPIRNLANQYIYFDKTRFKKMVEKYIK